MQSRVRELDDFAGWYDLEEPGGVERRRAKRAKAT